MSFAQPLFLLALALVPLAIVAYLRHERTRRAAAAAFAAPALQASVVPSAPGWRRHVPLVAYALALTILVLALARPQTTVAVPVERASIMLTTDFSGSMQATDVPPTRLAAARAAAHRFLDAVPDAVRVGLVAFNHTARLVESPTVDRRAVRAPAAGARGTIQVTRANGAVETRPVPPDPTESREVAEISGGRAYTADTAQNLSDVYKALGSRVGYRDEKREVTAAFSGGALVLVAGGALLSLAWFRRLV